MSSEHHTLVPLSFATLGTPAVSPQDADAERVRARTQGYSAGYAAGMQMAVEQARAQQAEHARLMEAQRREAELRHEAALAALSRAAEAFSSHAVETVESADRSLIAAALDLAEAILGAELRDGRRAAEASLHRVLEGADAESLKAVRMSPQEAQLIADQAEGAGVRIIADPSLRPGDAVADLSDGFLDARISTALTRCRDSLALTAASSGQGDRP